MDKFSIFSIRLKAVSKEKGFSQRELARLTDISRTPMHKYFTGQREPSISELFRICKALGTTSDYLLGLSDYKEPLKDCTKYRNNDIRQLSKDAMIPLYKISEYLGLPYDSFLASLRQHEFSAQRKREVIDAICILYESHSIKPERV